MNETATGPDEALRRHAARVLSAATTAELALSWANWPDQPVVEYLRGPEAGLVMVQGRIGGGGDRFNLGEATVTRATALLRGGSLSAECIGTSYVLGSDPEHAGLAAIFDALLGLPAERARVLSDVIHPLEDEQDARDRATRAQARSTVVDFLTVARENAAGSTDDEEDD
jgi:alpha-D-ribose 1-methylphosphonate 5-triphosphate synthase subunit PhnG